MHLGAEHHDICSTRIIYKNPRLHKKSSDFLCKRGILFCNDLYLQICRSSAAILLAQEIYNICSEITTLLISLQCFEVRLINFIPKTNEVIAIVIKVSMKNTANIVSNDAILLTPALRKSPSKNAIRASIVIGLN